MIVNAGGLNVGVAEPFLHLGDVGLMIERIGGGVRAQRMGAEFLSYERAIRRNQITVSGAENVRDVEQALGQRGTGACEPR